jgi:hypothetical protein
MKPSLFWMISLVGAVGAVGSDHGLSLRGVAAESSELSVTVDLSTRRLSVKTRWVG